MRRYQSNALLMLSGAFLGTVMALLATTLIEARQPSDVEHPAAATATVVGTATRSWSALGAGVPAQVGGASVTASAQPPPDPTATPAAAAARLQIPVLGIDAPVVSRGLDASRMMEAPSDAWEVAWYHFTAAPGAGGNAVFAGHLDYRDVGPAIFWDLGKLGAGDVVAVVLPEGGRLEYRVVSVDAWDETTAPVDWILAPTTVESVTLITCAGAFDDAARAYDQRLVVRAELLPAATP